FLIQCDDAGRWRFDIKQKGPLPLSLDQRPGATGRSRDDEPDVGALVGGSISIGVRQCVNEGIEDRMK
ncbi:MAG TPA: hypothetical protein VIK45_00450, partial [Candidatus Dormibacteraeota bacterium]